MPKPDVIFCAMPTIEFCTAAVLLKKQTGAKVVMDVRDYWPDIWEEAAPEKWRWLAKLFIAPWQFMLRWSLMRADRVMGFTDLAVDWAFSKVSRKRTPADMGVPMAYELQKFDEDVMQKARAGWDARGIDTKKTTICMIGTLTSRFAHLMHDAIEAVRLIPAEQRKNFRLVFAGTGEAAEGLKDAARDLPEIIFPGWIGAPDIQTLMERSCAGLLPYPNTADFLVAMPNKSIEYLAGGLPIMSCLRGQIGKLINTEDCGFSYTEGDVTSLATQFQRALNEPDTFEDKGHKARALYDRRFTPDAVYGGLIDALENLKK
jgi:glycosyltransferase involved in cell wall biosynthesis